MNARTDYLIGQRWFGGGAEAQILDIEKGAWIREPADGLGVRFELVHVVVDGHEQTYNIPAAYRNEPFLGLDNALMDHDGEYFVYDAIRDAHARTALLGGFFGAAVEGIEYAGTLPVDPQAHTVELVTDQSNSSFIIDNTLVVKLFRKVEPGRNPDIELSAALTESGSPSVAALRGRITVQRPATGDLDVAMVSDFVPSATTGWDTARASFRDLLADEEADADQAGGNFAAEAYRLGQTIAEVHGRLAAALERDVWGPAELGALADRLDARLTTAAAAVPAIAPYADAAHAAYDALRHLASPVAVQRVHGDLHLGQTLRGLAGWIVIDFEGEPAMPLADRLGLDSPLRDLAGMARSFDYAAHSVLLQTGAGDDARAATWIEHNRTAFLDGYGGAEPPELLRAYVIDKAVYEVGYESDHRPTWVDIPLRALARLLPG